jgi:hypothetical protein
MALVRFIEDPSPVDSIQYVIQLPFKEAYLDLKVVASREHRAPARC